METNYRRKDELVKLEHDSLVEEEDRAKQEE